MQNLLCGFCVKLLMQRLRCPGGGHVPMSLSHDFWDWLSICSRCCASVLPGADLPASRSAAAGTCCTASEDQVRMGKQGPRVLCGGQAA